MTDGKKENMLEKWAKYVDTFKVIMEGVEWLESLGFNPPSARDVEVAYAKYRGIDLVQLEEERTQLLEDFRKKTED